MSLDQTPPPASVDFEPPAYSQPTLPPPADEPSASPAMKRWGARFLVAGVVGASALTGAAWAFLPHAPAAAAAASLASVTPTKLSVNLADLAQAYPATVTESACVEASERTPVVLYSAITGGTPTTLEGDLFSGAEPVSGPNLTVTGRRIAVIRTMQNDEPAPRGNADSRGHYAGSLVVFDAATKQPLCATNLQTTSTTDLRWADVSGYAMRKDYVDSVRLALGDTEKQLKVDLVF